METYVMRTWRVAKPKRSALLPLIALCPSNGTGGIMPCSIFCCHHNTGTLEMYAMLEKKIILFLRRYY